MSGLALSFGSGEQLGSHPFAACLSGPLGCRVDEREFVVGEAERYGVASRVVAGRSSELGHALRIASTESLRQPLTGRQLCVYDKAMTTTAVQATIKTIGQSLYLVSTDRNGKQRVEFVGTREYGEALMAYRNGQAR